MKSEPALPQDLHRLLSWNRYGQDPFAFVTECCSTVEEVDTVNPIKLIPPLPHIQELVRQWSSHRLLCIVKSRRMLVTWTLCALDLHLALYTPHSAIYIVSNDQAKSNRLVGRCKFLFDHLPAELPTPQVQVRKGVSGDPSILRFPEIGSQIQGLPGEPDKLRQEGATLLPLEELAFWQWPEESWKAMLPTIQGGGRVVIASSARAGSFLEKIVKDQLPAPVGG